MTSWADSLFEIETKDGSVHFADISPALGPVSPRWLLMFYVDKVRDGAHCASLVALVARYPEEAIKAIAEWGDALPGHCDILRSMLARQSGNLLLDEIGGER